MIHIFANIARSKRNQTLKIGQVKEQQEKYFSSKIMQKIMQIIFEKALFEANASDIQLSFNPF